MLEVAGDHLELELRMSQRGPANLAFFSARTVIVLQLFSFPGDEICFPGTTCLLRYLAILGYEAYIDGSCTILHTARHICVKQTLCLLEASNP
jgi:hypothetical protein